MYNTKVLDTRSPCKTCINVEYVDYMFIDLMRSEDYDITNAVAVFLWNAFERRTLFLDSLRVSN